MHSVSHSVLAGCATDGKLKRRTFLLLASILQERSFPLRPADGSGGRILGSRQMSAQPLGSLPQGASGSSQRAKKRPGAALAPENRAPSPCGRNADMGMPSLAAALTSHLRGPPEAAPGPANWRPDELFRHEEHAAANAERRRLRKAAKAAKKAAGAQQSAAPAASSSGAAASSGDAAGVPVLTVSVAAAQPASSARPSASAQPARSARPSASVMVAPPPGYRLVGGKRRTPPSRRGGGAPCQPTEREATAATEHEAGVQAQNLAARLQAERQREEREERQNRHRAADERRALNAAVACLLESDGDSPVCGGGGGAARRRRAY